MKARVLDVRADRGTIFPRIAFRVELEDEKYSETVILALTGYASLMPSQAELGRLYPLWGIPATLHHTGAKAAVDLALDLDYTRLGVIEKERKGTDVTLRFSLNPVSFRRNQNPFDTMETSAIPAMSPSGTDTYTIPQSSWVKILQDVRYGRFVLFELPAPDLAALSPILERAVESLLKAQHLFHEGKNKEVITNCREAMEELKKIVLEKEDELRKRVDDGSIASSSEKKKSEKVFELRDSIHKFLHIGPHVNYKAGREDAKLALYTTLMITEYFTELLSE